MTLTIRSAMIAAAALALASCRTASDPSGAPSRLTVQVLTASYDTVAESLTVPGTVQARQRTALASQLTGFVKQVRFRAGDRVRAGEILVTLDAREPEGRSAAARAAIDEARAGLDEARHAAAAAESSEAAARVSLELARATYNRYEKLGQTRSASPQEIDEVRSRRDGAAAELEARRAASASAASRLHTIEAQLARAKAEAGRADVAVGWSVLRAPQGGRISERSIDPGSAVFPGTPLLVIESEGNTEIVAAAPAAKASCLAPGLEVRIRKAGGTEALSGRIARIIPRSSLAHTVELRIDLPPDSEALPGAFVTVEIPAGSRRAMLIPRSAVRETGEVDVVFVAGSDSRLQLRLVKSVPYDAGRLEIVSGMKPGEKLVREIDERLGDGAEVEIRP
jgi:HlyD family secretion protein